MTTPKPEPKKSKMFGAFSADVLKEHAAKQKAEAGKDPDRSNPGNPAKDAD